ncbi:ERF family protein [Neobacillus drentensis]|uniref:ERF family protein n=1 Tax=Neobacillus drentensis TaxID=220684 RepID=UPI001F231BE7|nr:ERF family protein [Neobacillus drentensis]ULT55431.1 ERF family protein [Neobacillus drentensis]
MTEQVEVKEEVKPLNLFQKIHAVMKDIEYLNKDDLISFNNTKYKAISEEKVTSTVRAALLKYGLVIMPVEQEHHKEGNLSTVNTKYKIVDIDTGQYETIVSSGTGTDSQDKGVGKAMTYSYKYLLLRTFAIPTGEDPDKISSAELDAKEQPKLASDKQLNLITNLLNKKVTEKWSFDTLYQNLKGKVGADNDMENWTMSEAKKAIDILQAKTESKSA